MLFRPEVMQSNMSPWTGAVRVAYSLPIWAVTTLAVVLAAALVAYGAYGSFARKTRVTGILVPHGGELNIIAPLAGRVTDLLVREGQAVDAGEILMTLHTDRVAESVEGTRDATVLVGAHIENRRRALASQKTFLEASARLQKQAIESRLRGLNLEIGKMQDEIELQQRRRDIATASLRRYEELAARRFVSSIHVQQHEEALIDQDVRLRSLERSLLSAGKEREASAMELQ